MGHSPTALLGEGDDDGDRKGEQAERDPNHEVGPRLPTPTEPNESTPGSPGGRKVLAHAWNIHECSGTGVGGSHLGSRISRDSHIPWPFGHGLWTLMGLLEGSLHFSDGGLHSHQNRTRHDAMTDVEFFDSRDPCDGIDVVVVESVPHMNVQAELASVGCGVDKQF